jgi:hypothetical protein
MLLFRHQNAGQNQNIKIDNRCFENVGQFKYLGTIVTNQNLIDEKIKRFNTDNAYNHSIQNILSFHLLSKNLRSRAYKTIILPVVLYGCETLPQISKEEYVLRMFVNRVLRIFESKRDEVMGG